MNKNVLFLNHKENACGIYQYGKRSSNILKKSEKYNFIYEEISSEEEYLSLVNAHNPIGIIYNYYPATMNWLNVNVVNKYPKIMHYGLHHEGNLPNKNLFNYILYVDSTHIDTINSYAIPRPLFEIPLPATVVKNEVPVISSFGFGFEHKGFEKIVKIVNEQFDKAVLRLHISTSFLGDKDGTRSAAIAAKCWEANVKDGILLTITNDFLSDQQLLDFLAESDLNIFMYDPITSHNCGLSSVMDYALSVRAGLAITKSDMFRHIVHNFTSIYVEDISLSYIMTWGDDVVKSYREKWSHANFIKRYESIISDTTKLKKVLGLEEYQPKNKYVCFLPFHGEFGWYLQTFVKRVQGYNHSNKIVCTKKGHECLFPSASSFYYDWKDIEDGIKVGILVNDKEEIKNKIKELYQTDDIHFLSSSETSWGEKALLSNHTFIPKSLHNLGLTCDVVFAPRNRTVDAHRNWTQENWQYVVNGLISKDISVGVCGTYDTSFHLDGIACKSYEHIDVDSDVEMMNNAKLIITQESGLQYLAFMCERPTFCIDHYHKNHGSDMHRNPNVEFREISYVWSKSGKLIQEIVDFLNKIKAQ